MTTPEDTELSEQITKYVRIAMTYARKNPNSHAVPMEKDVTKILMNLITLHTQKAKLEARISENEYLASAFSNEPFDAAATIHAQKRIAQLTNPTESEKQ